MKVTQSKKTKLFSLTQLTKEDLVSLHNTLSDYVLKQQIRLALLDLMPGDERVKLQSEEAINGYFESQGLVISGAKSGSNGHSNGAVGAATVASSFQESVAENDEEEELEEEELPL